MAGSIKGIIVEIGGDTSGLQKALSKVNSATSSLSRELRGVNSLLKLDPKNTELLKQKQDILNESIINTQDKLKQLQELKEKADNKMADGTEINSENYRALQREIINTENKLKNLKVEASNWTQAGRKIEEIGIKIQSVGNKIDSLGNKLTTRVTAPLVTLGVIGVKSAAEQEAAMQQVELIYGEASNTIKDFAENTAITFNISTKEAYKYSQVYGNLIQSITDDEEENALYTQELLKSSAIIASATGRTMEDVMDRIRSGLLGNTEAIEDLGVNVNVALLESTDAFKKFAGDKSWEQLDFQTQQQIRLFGILEQTTKKYGKEVNKNTASSIQKLTAKLNNLTSRLNKKLLPIADKILDKAEDFIDKLDDLTDEEMENIIQIGLMVAAAGPLVKILGTVTKTVGTASKGIGIFSQAVVVAKNGTTSSITSVNNLAKALKGLTSPTGLAITGVTALTTAVVYLALRQTEEQKAVKELADEMTKHKETLQEYNKSIDEATNSNLLQIDSVERLKKELKTLVDENGKVKDGYESRVSFILNELNSALGTEYKLNGNIIDSYKKLRDEIDETIEKKKAEIILQADQEKYANAIEKQTEAVENLKKVQDELGMSYEDAKKKYSDYMHSYIQKQASISEMKEAGALRNLINAYEDAEESVKIYTENVKTYEENYALFVEGKYEEINKTVTNSVKDWTNENLKTIKESIVTEKEALFDYEEIYKKTGNEIALEQTKQAEKNLTALAEELVKRTSTIEDLSEEEIEAWKTLATESYGVYKTQLDKMPDKMKKTIEEATGVVVRDNGMYLAAKNLAIDAENGFYDNVDGKTWGTDLTEEMSEGMTSQKSKSWITNAASTVAGWIDSILGFSIPEKGPLSNFDKSMPDMIDLMVRGIDSNKINLIKSAERLAENLNDNLNLQSNIPLNNFESAKINSQVIDSTRTIFTTPTLNIYAQDELTPVKMNSIIDAVNKRLGSQY